jgi:hypothetical protein
VPERDDDWYESKRRSMLPWQLYQEYPRDEEEAFIKSGNVVFDTEMLSKLHVEEPFRSGYIEPVNSDRWVQFHNSTGPLHIWQMPRVGHSYVIGADVAEGLEHGDFSSAHVIDMNTNRVVATWHGHMDPDLFGTELCLLGWWYQTALLGVENNNHGISTLNAIRRKSYPRVYYKTSYDQATNKRSTRMGWRTDRGSKPLMIDELQMAVREGSLVCLDEKTIKEMKTYVRDERGQMSGSPFDDRVISLAIANMMRKHAHSKEFAQEKTEQWGSASWWEEQLPKTEKGGNLGRWNVRDKVGMN